MKQFQAIYRILKALSRAMGAETSPAAQIAPEVVGLSEVEWEQILNILQKGGYIDGIQWTQTMSDYSPRLVHPIAPHITLKGLEYVEKNTLMKKAAKLIHKRNSIPHKK